MLKKGKIMLLAFVVSALCICFAANAQSLRDANGNMLYSGDNLPEITKGHPRLLLNSSDISELQRRMNDGEYSDAINTIRSQAALDLTGHLPAADPGEGNYNANVGYSATANALLYVLTGQDSYADKAISLVMNAAADFQFATSSKDMETRNAGFFLDSISRVYDWCYDKMTSEQRRTLILKVKDIARDFECGYPIKADARAVTGHAAEAQILQNYLSCAVAFYDEDKEMYEDTMKNLLDKFVPVRDFYFKGRLPHQGTGYGPYRSQYDMKAEFILRKAGLENLFTDDLKYMGYIYITHRRPDGLLMLEGDTNDQTFGEFFLQYPQILATGAALYNDPYLQYAFNHYPNAKSTAMRNGYNTTDMFLIYDSRIEEKSYTELPLTTYFGSPIGQMIARTNWKNGISTNTVIANMKVKEYFWSNHDHSDAGSFELYYKGNLAKDTGVYASYFSNHDKDYYKRTIASNSLLVYKPDELWGGSDSYNNDGGQTTPSWRTEPETLANMLEDEYRSGNVLAHYAGPNEETPEFSYLKGDISYAYSPDKVQFMTRSFVFINFKNTKHPAALITYDKITASNPDYKKYWLLHSVQKPEIEGNVTTILRDEDGYNGKLVNTTLIPEQSNTYIDLVGGKVNNQEYEAFGKNFPQEAAAGGDANDEKDTWRIQISPRLRRANDTFFNVMQVMDPETAPYYAERIDLKHLQGVNIGGKTVLFSKVKELVSDEITVPVNENTTSLFICDLQPGYWTAYKNGSMIDDFEVSDDEKCIAMTVSEGNYKFIYNKNENVPITAGLMSNLYLTENTEGMMSNFNLAETEEAAFESEKSDIVFVINEKNHKDIEIYEDENGAVYLPLRKVTQVINGSFSQNNEEITASTDFSDALIKTGESNYIVNGISKSFIKPLIHRDGESFVYYEDLGNILNAKIKYNDFTRGIYLKIRLLGENECRINSVTTNDVYDATTPPENLIDGATTTRAAIGTIGAWYQFELAQLSNLSSIDIAWHQGIVRKARFEIQASADGKSFETVYKGESSGETLRLEKYVFDKETEAKFIRLINFGNTLNNWCSPTEIKLYK